MTDHIKYNWYIDGHPKQMPGTYAMFYPINCSYVIGDWIETQDAALWYQIHQRHLSNYMINEQLLVIINLKWPGRT